VFRLPVTTLTALSLSSFLPSHMILYFLQVFVHRSCITVGHLQCIDGSLYGDGSVSVWLTFRLVDSAVPPSTNLDYRGSAACCSNDLLVQLYVEQFEHEVTK
jgi:hypothetical protein